MELLEIIKHVERENVELLKQFFKERTQAGRKAIAKLIEDNNKFLYINRKVVK